MKDSGRSAAVLVDGPTVQAWQRDVLEAVATETDVSLDLVVLRDEAGPSTGDAGSGPSSVVHRLPKSAWELYRVYRRRRPDIPDRRRHRIDNIDALDNAERTECTPIPTDPIGNELPDTTVERLTEFDIGIRFGFGILLGDALDAPADGVLSVHHGDLREYRGRPAGFWEFLHGDDTAGITLQRLSETLDGGEIVAYKSVDFHGVDSWPAGQQRLLEQTADLFVRGLENLADPAFCPKQPDRLGDLYTDPEAVDVLRYLLRAAIQTV